MKELQTKQQLPRKLIENQHVRNEELTDAFKQEKSFQYKQNVNYALSFGSDVMSTYSFQTVWKIIEKGQWPGTDTVKVHITIITAYGETQHVWRAGWSALAHNRKVVTELTLNKELCHKNIKEKKQKYTDVNNNRGIALGRSVIDRSLVTFYENSTFGLVFVVV